MQKGLFITFEGNDGCGKTTVSKYIYDLLKEQGYPVIYTREPGGIDIAEQIREIILNPKNTAMDARTEALLYAASRRQHLVEKVLPALNDHQIVLCDRFIDSSLAYQGMGRGLGIDEVLHMNEFAVEGHMPDATIFLEVSLEIGMERIQSRGQKDRLDNEAKEFHILVAKGYEEVKKRFANRMYCVNADEDIEIVIKNTYNKIMEIIQPYV